MISHKRKQRNDDNIHQKLQQSKNNGVIALLDLPPQSYVAIDGIPQIIQRDDFVGIFQVPANTFHLVVTRQSSNSDSSKSNLKQQNYNPRNISPGVGLIIYHNNEVPSTTSKKLESDHLTTENKSTISSDYADSEEMWIIARRYDPQTEEMSSDKLSVDFITCTNLCHAIQANSIQVNRIVPYHIFLQGQIDGSGSGRNNEQNNVEDVLQNWNKLTCFISPTLLKMRNLMHGEKVVPGCYDLDTDITTSATESKNRDEQYQDGVEIEYPPIPCINFPTNMKQLKQKGGKYCTDNTPTAQHRLFSRSQHLGTTKYLESLSPSQRTALYLNSNDSFIAINKNNSTIGSANVLNQLLHQYYNDKWQLLMGDFQLSFLIFLHLGCLSSFIHWRDLLSMLTMEQHSCFSSNESEDDAKDATNIHRMSHLYNALLSVLVIQIESMDVDFFEEVEYSEGNFFVPALRRLYELCTRSWFCREKDIRVNILGLVTLVSQRFKIDITTEVNDNDDNHDEIEGNQIHDTDMFDVNNDDVNDDAIIDSDNSLDDEDNVDMFDGIAKEKVMEEEKLSDFSKKNVGAIQHQQSKISQMTLDEDGPIVVPFEEVEASLARSCNEDAQNRKPAFSHSPSLRQSYPLLFAAMTPQEDILMACARILDEKVDVSLVREAASYLETVENNI